MTTIEAIKLLESKGYIVGEEANTTAGVLDTAHPICYSIYRPDYSRIYGSNSCSPAQLILWAEQLAPIVAEPPTKSAPPFDPVADAERSRKEREWDDVYNEGGEGYNPYRD